MAMTTDAQPDAAGHPVPRIWLEAGEVRRNGTGAVVSATPVVMSATPPFAAIKTAPGLARGHVRATLAGWRLGGAADDAETIASELTANAVNASAPMLAAGRMPVIRVCLISDGDVLTIECWDQAPGLPVLRQADGFAETGRGLAIIDAITGGCWGCQPATGQDGKCVYAEIPLRAARAGRILAESCGMFQYPFTDNGDSNMPPATTVTVSEPDTRPGRDQAQSRWAS